MSKRIAYIDLAIILNASLLIIIVYNWFILHSTDVTILTKESNEIEGMDELSEGRRVRERRREGCALLRVFGMSANERLGGWSIIRANIQDAQQPS